MEDTLSVIKQDLHTKLQYIGTRSQNLQQQRRTYGPNILPSQTCSPPLVAFPWASPHLYQNDPHMISLTVPPGFSQSTPAFRPSPLSPNTNYYGFPPLLRDPFPPLLNAFCAPSTCFNFPAPSYFMPWGMEHLLFYDSINRSRPQPRVY